MKHVITQEQARKITGGRTPLIPVVYEEALRALQACITLEEGKYWSDKADALAAWARIYRDDTIERQARILKLRAYRRMGELGRELRPPRSLGTINGKHGGSVGAAGVLRQHGLSRGQAAAAVTLANAPAGAVEELELRKHVPSPQRAQSLVKSSDPLSSGFLQTLSSLAGYCRQIPPERIKAHLTNRPGGHRDNSRANAVEVFDWMQIFLGKDKPT